MSAATPRSFVNLLERAREHEIGRRHAKRDVVLGNFTLLIEHGRPAIDTVEIGIGIRLGLDRMLAVEEVRRLLIRTGELAQHIGAADSAAAILEALVVLFLLLKSVHHDVVIDGVHAGEFVALDRIQPRKLVRVHALEELDLRERTVADQ